MQALAVGGMDFEDRRVSYQQVVELRAAGKLPNGQVPVLEIDGACFGQSRALLAWVGRQTGLYTDDLQLHIDAVEGTLADIVTVLNPQWYGSALPRNPRTGGLVPDANLSASQKAAVQRALNEDILPARFAQLEAMLTASGGPHMCGPQLTTCDLSLYVLASGLRDPTSDYCAGIEPSVLDRCPKLLELIETVGQHERVAVWNDAH
jgi:glutathione S-transferase